MNEHKQSKSSIIFQECWCASGATTEQIHQALTNAGYEMPVEEKLLPMLRTYKYKGLLNAGSNKWYVNENPQPPKHRKKRRRDKR